MLCHLTKNVNEKQKYLTLKRDSNSNTVNFRYNIFSQPHKLKCYMKKML